MKTPRRTMGRGVGFDMTPMIDIVFQLIIFFLVSSHLARQEAQMKLPLPLAGSGEKAEEEAVPRITLNIQHDGVVLWGTSPVAMHGLEARLREKRTASGDGLEVRIRCDRRVPYAAVSPLLRACAKAGIWNVTFAVVRPEDARK